jgi:ABC-type dipeptide/oligopeptide/nickel transport system permease subunit
MVPTRSLWVEALLRLSRNIPAMLGLMLVVAMFFVAIFAPVLAPYSSTQQDLSQAERPPSLQHLLGTDDLGRDVLSRIIWGARTAALVATIVTLTNITLGVSFGALAGYYGGWVDTLVMRITDFLFAFPGLLFALFIAATIKPSIIEWVRGWEALVGLKGLARSGLLDYFTVILALGLVGWPGMARLVRGQFLTLKQKEFVEGARAIGASSWRIIVHHILPNALSPVIVAVSLGMGGIIISEAVLSFVGIGIQPPNASWGAMIYDNYSFWRTRPHLVLAPGLVLASMVFAFNFLGDGLNDALNPRTRQ